MGAHDYRDSGRYTTWIQTHDTITDAGRQLIREAIERFADKPLFSIVQLLIGDKTDLAIASIRNQLYPHFECLPAGPGAIAAAHGRFILPLPAHAILCERALFELASAINESPQSLIFYTDEDQIDAAGLRSQPWFKTAWDPDLMLGRDAIGLLVAYNRELLLQLDLSDLAPGNLALYDLALRATYAVLPTEITHIPEILCHRTIDPDAPPAWDAPRTRAILRRHFDAIGEQAGIEPAPLAPQWNRILRPIPSPPPLVSVLIPTRDRAALLARSTEAILTRTDYPNMELLIADNGTREPDALALLRRLSQDKRVRILPADGPFNYAALNNQAALVARGEILVLLNNDTDVEHPGWLSEMVSHAIRPDVGIVGAKLLYEDGRVQHAGVVFDANQEVIHPLRLSARHDPGPDGELALTRTVLAVTGACLAIRRAVYFEIGQLDARNLIVSFNDIDLCLRAGDHGYRIVFTPFAELLHLESASRGPLDASPRALERFARERRWFQATWQSVVADDPFHKPNIAYAWQGTKLATPPRRKRSWLK